VNHSLSLESASWLYLQKFVLVREGFGSTISMVTNF